MDCYGTCKKQFKLFLCRHYPVGVLFDLHGNTDNLPWNLTVHFQVHVRRVMRKHVSSICENKGTDQLCGPAQLISAFVFAT